MVARAGLSSAISICVSINNIHVTWFYMLKHSCLALQDIADAERQRERAVDAAIAAASVEAIRRQLAFVEESGSEDSAPDAD